MFLPHFVFLCDLLQADARQHGIYLFYIIKKIKYTEKNAFLFQISPGYTEVYMSVQGYTRVYMGI